MTDQAPIRKVISLCIAAAAASLLSGCGNGDLSESLARIKNVPVDASEAPKGSDADRKLDKKDVALLVSTAKAMTTDNGGLFNNDNKVQIAIVDPLDMKRPDAGVPLDERLGRPLPDPALEQMKALQAAAHDLPDLPIGRGNAAPAVVPHRYATVASLSADATPGPDSSSQARPNQDRPNPERLSARVSLTPAKAIAHAVVRTAPVADTNDGARLIQVGSFGTIAAAHNAWADLNARYPAVTRYSPTYQKMVTAQGKAMFRLKLGPVRNDDQARALCDKLAIHDTWCVKAG